ncbi:MAG: hypothetical protein FWC56_05190, partial [Phycisphaerae bacterium]|nr:hypothetical protein [Phycisphaerae bacterium]
IVRGADRQWVHDLFGFAPVPHLVMYLKIDVPTLIRRATARGPLDYFEAGMDAGLGDDWYDSFKKYQTLVIREYNKMAEEFGFCTVNAQMEPEQIQKQLRARVTQFFQQASAPNQAAHHQADTVGSIATPLPV